MVLVIVMASITASYAAATTSASIITVVIIIVIDSAGCVKLSVVALVLAPVVILLSTSPLLESSIGFSACMVCGLCYYLYNSHYDNSCLSLHTVPLLLGEGEVVEAVVAVLICLYLISFLLYLLCFLTA